jgi:hypothetical protein
MLAMSKADFTIVRKTAAAFPGVVESLYYGQPALELDGKMVACMASHRSAEPGSPVVRIDFRRREELLAEAPETFYITDHYTGYPAVLVRLPKIQPDVLRGLLAGALDVVRHESPRRTRSTRELPTPNSKLRRPGR